MITSDTTALLSSSDREALEHDAAILKKAIRLALKLAPGALLFTGLCFYFDWMGIVKFIGVVSTAGAFYILLISYIHVRKLSADLKANTKTIAAFLIHKKKVMGYVDVTKSYEDRGLNNRRMAKREISISDERILKAIADKAEYEKNEVNTLFSKTGMGNDDKILKYTFHLKGQFLSEKKPEELLVPIDYYLTGMENETVEISYAERSKKVFKIENKKRV